MTTAVEAQLLLRQGRVDDAERAFQDLLRKDGSNLEALNFVALASLQRGDLTHAQTLLERARGLAPSDPTTQHHLGLVYEAAGNLNDAIDCHRAALLVAGHFHVARLHLGRALERNGQGQSAVLQYARALQDAQQVGRWLNPGTTPPPLLPLVEHAVIAVRQGRRAAFAVLFDPIRNKYGRSALDRVEACLKIYLNEETPQHANPRQLPSFLYLPGMPASAYLDRSLFPWIDALEARTAEIRNELLTLMPSAAGRERVFASAELENVNLRGLGTVPTWNGYYFFRHGERRDDNCRRCPVTTAVLSEIPLSQVRDHGPEVLFSVFTPGTHLLPHRGVTNTRLVGHLPLIVPNDCALNVGGEIHRWQEGRVVIFDDTFEHEAWNRSQATRVVLIFDIWNPFLSEAERGALADLIAAIGDFRKAMESA